MSIGAGLTLVTGPTGGGKSALVVSWLLDLNERPIFSMGIPELAIEHQPVPPVAEWTELRPAPEDPSLTLPYFTFPPKSVVVIDEAQRVFRPLPSGARVPPEVAAFETRRHTGADFVLVTQFPHLLHANVRKLVTRHIHIHDTFLGRYTLEWVGVGDPESKASRELATRKRYKPPKKAFGLYKSAEAHTKIKRNYPWYMYAMAVVVPLAIYLSYYTYQRISNKLNGNEKAELVTTTSNDNAQVTRQTTSTSADSGSKPLTLAEYVAREQPRIPGLMHTAPLYDQVTAPVEAPEPIGCIDSKKAGCKCYTQQGTRYDTTEDMCRQIMDRGIFLAWKSSKQQQYAQGTKPREQNQEEQFPAAQVLTHQPVQGLSAPVQKQKS